MRTILILLFSLSLCFGQIMLDPDRAGHWAVAGGGSITALPQSATTVQIDPHLDDDWVSPTNVTDEGSNDASITSNNFDSGDQSYILKAYNFDFSGIPGGSTIVGIEVIINGRTQVDNNHTVDYVRTLNANNNPYGNDNGSTNNQNFMLVAADYTWGSSSDMWGRSSLDIDSVQNSNFGVGFGVLSNQNNANVYSDYVKITVHYE